MKSEILHRPGFAELKVYLEPGESITSEAGAMVYMSPTIKVKTNTGGGFLKGITRRMVAGETLFMNTYYTENEGGYIAFAPSVPGDITEVEVTKSLYIADTNYLASQGLNFGLKFTGFKGILTPGGMFWFKVSGIGKVWIASYGGIDVITLKEGEKLLVDNIHLTAFDSDLDFKIRKFGKMKTFLFGGEFFLTEFVGPGRIWIQSRNLPIFAKTLARF